MSSWGGAAQYHLATAAVISLALTFQSRRTECFTLRPSLLPQQCPAIRVGNISDCTSRHRFVQHPRGSDVEIISDHSSYRGRRASSAPNGHKDKAADQDSSDEHADSSARKGRSVSLAQMEDIEEERQSLLETVDSQRPTIVPPRAPIRSASSSNSNTMLMEVYQEEDDATYARQVKIKQILDEDDKEWREERKKKVLGRYAGIKSMDDLKRIEEEDFASLVSENKKKAQIANEAGVTLTILDPTEYSLSNPLEPKSNFNPTNIKSKVLKNSWFDNIDDELNDEIENISTNGISNNKDDEDNENKVNGPRFVNGKPISRSQQMGVRVGSAGGWSLEVFPGDFLVHRKYGIGCFRRTVLQTKLKLSKEEIKAQQLRRQEIVRELMEEKKLDADDIQAVVNKFGTDENLDEVSNPVQTVLEIEYVDATVHVPVNRAYRLSRYRAGDSAVKPRLSRVKGEAWAKAKGKVEEDTLQMAQDVLALYATRETLYRIPFDPTKEVHMRDFQKTFQFEPTPDQISCFEAVENDMVWRSRPMDRLVCGDVGFGKTEVALRALFRCIQNGRQAAMLSPTGVLAAQHVNTILKRMGPDTPFNFRVALLRGGMGKNTKAGRALRDQIEKGEVELVVGTHALLSNGLKFKDLGLLVVDEEQRFGVKQKERLKLICNGVDVLTLSATPIPRTLQMSLSGIRDTSTIRSPPPMRKSTITYVQEFNKELVRDAIDRELERGGQCYYVVPRISQLDEAEKIVKELFPDIRVIQAHGRMTRGGAEANVAAFAEGEYDMLLATTVIENGVDIPTVNTMIIQNAQAFGMSTLYQLRGRVGRSSLQGYAYFLHKEEAITEQSAMRLQAMADLHELGSGFDVANRDLEIRGAGSLLGTEQSGMAAKVGFDLYMRMLKKSIRQLRGLDIPMVPRTNVILPQGEGGLEILVGSDGVVAHPFQIPESYISDNNERLKQEGIARLAESTNQLVELTNSWKVEYGALPASLQEKLKTLHLHACTRTLGIDLVGLEDMGDGRIDCVLRSPGLRPRHWAHIAESLPKGVPTKGLNVIFPSRFTLTTDDVQIPGGKRIDVENFIPSDSTNGYGNEEEEWDTLDQEEVEAMKEISSSMNVKDMSEIDINEYPRFVIPNLANLVKEGSRVDAILKLLLPSSKIVHEKQESDKEKARIAAELREKREMMKRNKKTLEGLEARRSGYSY